MKRYILRVRYKNRAWQLSIPGEKPLNFLYKYNAVKKGRSIAHTIWAINGQVSQLVVSTKNGKWQFEHTYGRDPRRHKG